MDTEQKRKQGKRNRSRGKAFEKKCRDELSKDGWIIVRWDKNIEFLDNQGRLIQSKGKFNPFTKQVMMIDSGMPDFLCVRWTDE